MYIFIYIYIIFIQQVRVSSGKRSERVSFRREKDKRQAPQQAEGEKSWKNCDETPPVLLTSILLFLCDQPWFRASTHSLARAPNDVYTSKIAETTTCACCCLYIYIYVALGIISCNYYFETRGFRCGSVGGDVTSVYFILFFCPPSTEKVQKNIIFIFISPEATGV